MTNADKFRYLFGIYATELWAMSENDFLEWLNADAQDMPTVERKTGQWIPCSERLPEKAEGRYWVCTNTGYQCQCRWTDDVYGLGSNGEWVWKIFDIPQYSHVVAWMPLPEAYKEVTE